MKKVFLVVMLSLGLFANAQEFRFGIKGGANLAKLTSSEEVDFAKFKNRIGFHAGILLEATFGNRFSIQPEVMYSAEGSKINEFLGGKFKGTLKLDYVSVPLIAKLYLFEGFSIEGGPQVAFNVKSEFDVDGNLLGNLSGKYELLGKIDEKITSSIEKNITSYIEESVQPYSFSWCLGAGYEFGKVRIGARYNFGVTEIFSGEKKELKDVVVGSFNPEKVKEVVQSKKLKNGILQMSIGVYF